MPFTLPHRLACTAAFCAFVTLTHAAITEPAASTSVPSPVSLAATKAGPALKFGFSTLGCPDLDLAGVRALAVKHRQHYIEIRTLNGTVDFVPELAKHPGGAAGAREFLMEADVHVQLVASSFQLTRSTVAQRAQLASEAEAGEALSAKWVRVFGGGKWGEPLTAEQAATARAHRTWWNELRAARGWTIDLLLETHDSTSAAAAILDLMEKSGGPMPVLWDTHHTWKIGGETAAATWARLGPLVRHVNVKDSISQPSDKLPYTYVAQGSGEFPTPATLALLDAAHFDGVITFEWEKQWHPSLASLDSVLPDWNRAIASFQRPPDVGAAPTSLFDGRTLTGWDGDAKWWRVQDGVLTGGSSTEKIPHNFFLATTRSFQNFDLRLKLKLTGDPKTGMINSGVQIRSLRVPQNTEMSGYQVDAGDGWWGKLYDESRRNKVIAESANLPAVNAVVRPGDWNDYRILAEGPRVRTWINGVAAIDYTETEPAIAHDGHIAIQIHSGGIALVQAKDVTIEELPPSPGAPTWDQVGHPKPIPPRPPTQKPAASSP